MSLVNHLEEKCLLVTKRVTEVTEQIEKVEENGMHQYHMTPPSLLCYILFVIQ